MSKHIHSPAFIEALRRETREMTDDAVSAYAAEAMESDRARDRLQRDIEQAEECERFDLCS